jgi:hypothetical protein
MEERFDLYRTAFHGSDVAIDEGVEFAAAVFSCFAESLRAWNNFASPFA